MAITTKMVKDLRDSTGVGMMDAKKALIETNGDFESATDWLRQKGLAKAQKKSGRIAAEGLIGIKYSSNSAILIEANCETDFVARNEEFQDMITHILDNAAGKTTLNEISYSSVPSGERVYDGTRAADYTGEGIDGKLRLFITKENRDNPEKEKSCVKWYPPGKLLLVGQRRVIKPST